jgi:hypothetical protein
MPYDPILRDIVVFMESNTPIPQKIDIVSNTIPKVII